MLAASLALIVGAVRRRQSPRFRKLRVSEG
jgi:hypothetical protein